MLRVILAIALMTAALQGVGGQMVFAQSTNNGLERLKTDIYRYGIGKNAKVVVRKKDGTKIKGYINRTLGDTFEITNKKKQLISIAYVDVAQVGRPGMRLGAKIAMISTATVVVVAVGIAIGVREAFDNDLE